MSGLAYGTQVDVHLNNKHGLYVFQSVVAPNGIICHLFGPLEGRRHDAFMLSESGLLQKLEEKW